MSKTILLMENNSQTSNLLIGNKGSGLDRLRNLGILLPNYFVITTKEFRYFLKINNIIDDLDLFIKKIDTQDTEHTNQVLEFTKQAILNATFPKKLSKKIMLHCHKLNSPLIAVRSSTTLEDSEYNSWAGQFDSYLNIQESELLHYIKKCWLSFLSLPVIVHYQKMSKPKDSNSSIAVIVQTMIQSSESGVVFTKDTDNNDSNLMLIEAIFGLGTGIVSGEINADVYLYNKKLNKIISKKIAKQVKKICYNKLLGKNTFFKIPANFTNQQKLSDEKIIELAQLSKKLEYHFQKPLDIEWAFVDQQLFITQVRPIAQQYILK